jgi:hypothetical protein
VCVCVTLTGIFTLSFARVARILEAWLCFPAEISLLVGEGVGMGMGMGMATVVVMVMYSRNWRSGRQ